MDKELSVAIDLAESAGAVIQRLRSRAARAEQKADGDPVTEADRASDALIRSGLEAAFPGDAILSEETPDDPARLGRSRLWLVDPLDGTRHFIAGREEYAVMIGLAVDGEPRLGVVHLPAEGITWAGGDGLGVHRVQRGASRRVSLDAHPPDRRRAVVTASRSRPHSRVMRVARRLGGAEVLVSGSVGRKAALVLDGRADAYVTLGSRSSHWDACAPDAIVRAAGGVFADAAGTPITYNVADTRNARGLLACRSGVFRRVVDTIREVVDGEKGRSS